MCYQNGTLTKHELNRRLTNNKKRRDLALGDYITTNDIIPNTCGAKFDGKKMPSHIIGYKGCERRFTPCRTKGKHPKTGAHMNMHLHHINGDNTDDRKKNLVRLCPYCHERIHLLMGRKTLYTIKSFINWWDECCTNIASFVTLGRKGLLPAFIPSDPKRFYKTSGEWPTWKNIIKQNLYTGKKAAHARNREILSAKKHFSFLTINKITSMRMWDQMLNNLGGFRETGLLSGKDFTKIYKKQWQRFGQELQNGIIKFDYRGKKAPTRSQVQIAITTTKRLHKLTKLQELIDKENKQKPLKDSQLAKHLKITRHTTGKYRRQLNIPTSTKRKKK